MISIWIHPYIIYILIWALHLFRVRRGCRCMLWHNIWWRICSIRGLELTDSCYNFLLLRFPKGIKTLWFSFSIDWDVGFLNDMRSVVKHVHVSRTIQKVWIDLDIKSIIIEIIFRQSDNLIALFPIIIFRWLFSLNRSRPPLVTLIRLLWLWMTRIVVLLVLLLCDLWVSPLRLVVSMWLRKLAWGCWLDGGQAHRVSNWIFWEQQVRNLWMAPRDDKVFLWRAHTTRTLDLVWNVVVVLRVDH